MAIPITREEYKKKFGTPPPIPITRDEFEKKFGVPVGETISAEEFANIRRRDENENLTQGNQFAPQDTSTIEDRGERISEKVRRTTTGIFGGGKLFEGLGKALAAPFVRKNTQESQDVSFKQQEDILRRIKEKEAKGEDTTRLRELLGKSQDTVNFNKDVEQDFTESADITDQQAPQELIQKTEDIKKQADKLEEQGGEVLQITLPNSLFLGFKRR